MRTQALRHAQLIARPKDSARPEAITERHPILYFRLIERATSEEFANVVCPMARENLLGSIHVIVRECRF